MISEEYRKEQERLHINPDYGVASVQFAPLVSQIINKLGITDLLDYGAGKGRLMQSLKVGHKLKVQCYDPGVPAWADPPIPMQMCTCIDVLEHIEPEHLESVLDDLKRVTQAVGFFTVHTGPAAKILSDGRNAHLIQQPMEWWLPKFMERFELQTVQRLPAGFYVIAFSKPSPLIEVEKNGAFDVQRTQDESRKLASP